MFFMEGVSMEQWLNIAKKNGIKPDTFKCRVRRQGWSPEKAATTPAQGRRDKKWVEKAKENGINRKTFISRVDQHGWSPEKAATTPPAQRGRDRKWIKIAEENGIGYHLYKYRVCEMLWSPEEAATTPKMSKQEVSRLGLQARKEFREIIDERIFNDETNMFKLTSKHLEIAEKNGITRTAVKDRVYNSGWSVQEAITTPIRRGSWSRPPKYFEYMEIAKRNGINGTTYYFRVKRGWPLEDAATKKPISPSQSRRSDSEWIDLAIKNGIERGTYYSRTRLGWTPEEAATIPPLKNGEFLNEQRKENARVGFENFMNIKNRKKTIYEE